MVYVYVYTTVLIVLAIIFCVWYAKIMFKPITDMKKMGSGERTKFIINTADKGYDYYKNIIENWLKSNKFSKYDKKRKCKILKYKDKIKGITYKFGFNYYESKSKLIIETFLFVLGAEYPLTEKNYVSKKSNVEIAVGTQGKEAYIDFLKSLLEMPNEISNSNNVQIKI